MKLVRIITASAIGVAFISSSALAQQTVSGSITKIDELGGKISIQQTQSGTVGSSAGAAAEDFKLQDGLMFNSLQPGDKVTFTAVDMNGVKTITNLRKQ